VSHEVPVYADLLLRVKADARNAPSMKMSNTAHSDRSKVWQILWGVASLVNVTCHVKCLNINYEY
jgi:hypothetical protein